MFNSTISKTKILKTSMFNFFSEELKKLFFLADAEYENISKYYDFNCLGCNSSCCSTIFYHHTLVEYLYVITKFNTSSTKFKKNIEEKAIAIYNKTNQASQYNLMCPFNLNSQCIVYEYRPLLCRLHGVPNKLQYPNNKTLMGSGCHKFENELSQKVSVKLNRTPFFKELINIESKTQKAFGFNNRVKITISEMIINRNNFK